MATAFIGFGGEPWAAFAIGSSLIVVLGTPRQWDTLKQYRRQPKTDIILGMLFDTGIAIAAAFVSAWVGYGLRYFLLPLLKT